MYGFDPHQNFAITTVAVAPAPPTSGVTLDVRFGDGALFPDPATAGEFNCVVWPSTIQPTADNAEIVRVVARVGDSFVIERAQEGTTAKSIQGGYSIAVSVTEKTIADIERASGQSAFNVETYGARPELADSTAEIQAAIDAAYAAGGGVVFFPRLYKVSTLRYRCTNDVVVRWLGAHKRNSGVTQIAGTAAPIVQTHDTSERMKYLDISHMNFSAFDNQVANQGGIHWQGTGESRVYECFFGYCRGFHLKIQGGLVPGDSQNNIVEKNQFYHCGGPDPVDIILAQTAGVMPNPTHPDGTQIIRNAGLGGGTPTDGHTLVRIEAPLDAVGNDAADSVLIAGNWTNEYTDPLDIQAAQGIVVAYNRFEDTTGAGQTFHVGAGTTHFPTLSIMFIGNKYPTDGALTWDVANAAANWVTVINEPEGFSGPGWLVPEQQFLYFIAPTNGIIAAFENWIDSSPLFQIGSVGDMSWGPGGVAPVDVLWKRDGVGLQSLYAEQRFGRTSTSDIAWHTFISGENFERVKMYADGHLWIGPGNVDVDVSISRRDVGEIQMGAALLKAVASPAYGVSITPTGNADVQLIEVTNGVGFAINAPALQHGGRSLVFVIHNNSGGAMGAISWDGGYHLAGAFTNPANGKYRVIEFLVIEGGLFVERSRTDADS